VIIRVFELSPDPEVHEAPMLEVDLTDGALSVTGYDRDLNIVSYTCYAKGFWRKYEITEQMSEEDRAVIEIAQKTKLEEELAERRRRP